MDPTTALAILPPCRLLLWQAPPPPRGLRRPSHRPRRLPRRRPPAPLRDRPAPRTRRLPPPRRQLRRRPLRPPSRPRHADDPQAPRALAARHSHRAAAPARHHPPHAPPPRHRDLLRLRPPPPRPAARPAPPSRLRHPHRRPRGPRPAAPPRPRGHPGRGPLKEAVLSPKGLRLTWLCEEAHRGRYLIFRDAEMGLAPLAPETLQPLLDALLSLRAALQPERLRA
jgi:hypothetical protein